MDWQYILSISRNLMALADLRGKEVCGRVVIGAGVYPATGEFYLMAGDEMQLSIQDEPGEWRYVPSPWLRRE
jgi:hypothetical protein